MAKIRGAVKVDTEKCKGCSVCLGACPSIGCASCAIVCPDGVISVYKVKVD